MPRSKKPVPKWQDFENRLRLVMDGYKAAGIADIEKCYPPALILNGGRKVKALTNPWLDFTGAWSEMGGRMIHVEAKTSEEDTLPIREDSNLQWEQVNNSLRWASAGCAVIFLWEFSGEVRFFTPRGLGTSVQSARHVRWCDCWPVPAGEGLITHDFLAPLRRIYQHQTTITTPPQNENSDLP